MSQWIDYQFNFVFKRWLNENIIYKLQGIDRDFYCQSDIENGFKCKIQCDHCKEYYSPLEDK